MDLTSIQRFISNKYQDLKEDLKQELGKIVNIKPVETPPISDKEKEAIYKAFIKLKTKGYVLPLGKEANLESMQSYLPHMRALNCSRVFAIKLLNLDEGALELVLFSDDEKLETFPLTLNEKVEEVVNEKVPSDSVSVNQLEEVASWLENHGDASGPKVSMSTIEKRLNALMQRNACPHGAYVLHAAEKKLTLSRVNYKGEITHASIDFKNKHGLFTHDITGQAISESRTQFKKRLSGIGQPARIRQQD